MIPLFGVPGFVFELKKALVPDLLPLLSFKFLMQIVSS